MDIRVATKLIQDKVHQVERQRKAAEASADTAAPIPTATSSPSVSANQSAQTTPVSQIKSQQNINVSQPSAFTTSMSTPVLQSLTTTSAEHTTSSVSVLSSDSGIGGIAAFKSETNGSVVSTYPYEAATDGSSTYGSQQVASGVFVQQTTDTITPSNAVSQSNTAMSMHQQAAAPAGGSSQMQQKLPAISEPALASTSTKYHISNTDLHPGHHHSDTAQGSAIAALPTVGGVPSDTVSLIHSDGSNHSSTASANIQSQSAEVGSGFGLAVNM